MRENSRFLETTYSRSVPRTHRRAHLGRGAAPDETFFDFEYHTWDVWLVGEYDTCMDGNEFGILDVAIMRGHLETLKTAIQIHAARTTPDVGTAFRTAPLAIEYVEEGLSKTPSFCTNSRRRRRVVGRRVRGGGEGRALDVLRFLHSRAIEQGIRILGILLRSHDCGTIRRSEVPERNERHVGLIGPHIKMCSVTLQRKTKVSDVCKKIKKKLKNVFFFKSA